MVCVTSSGVGTGLRFEYLYTKNSITYQSDVGFDTYNYSSPQFLTGTLQLKGVPPTKDKTGLSNVYGFAIAGEDLVLTGNWFGYPGMSSGGRSVTFGPANQLTLYALLALVRSHAMFDASMLV